MTDEQLMVMEERTRAATSGPWVWDGDEMFSEPAGGGCIVTVDITDQTPVQSDRFFIAASREDMQDLIDEVRLLRMKLKYRDA